MTNMRQFERDNKNNTKEDWIHNFIMEFGSTYEWAELKYHQWHNNKQI